MKVNTLLIMVISVLVIVLASSPLWLGCSSCKASHETLDLTPFKIKNLEGKANIVPILIIGSGPGGLSSAVYGARARMHTVVIEGSKPGGLLTETTEVENWPGEISILGPDIVANLKKQALHVGAEFLTESVERVDFTSWPYAIHVADGSVIHALSVIISTGATPRKLDVPGEKEYWARGVTSCAICDAPFFKGEDVVVAGGGDSAVEEAIQLSPYVKSVTVLVRSNKMRAAASMQQRLKGYSNVSIKYEVAIKEIQGNGSQVTGVLLKNTKTNEESLFPTAGVFLAVGHNPNTAIFKDQIELTDNGYIMLKKLRSQQTTVPGVFAAGDVEDYLYRQAGVAAGSGIKAALEASWFLGQIGISEDVIKQIESRFFHATWQTASPAVQQVKSTQELNDLLKKDAVVFLDFTKSVPVYEQVAHELGNKAIFAVVDGAVTADVAQELLVGEGPCLLVYRNGELVARYNHQVSEDSLRAIAEKFV